MNFTSAVKNEPAMTEFKFIFRALLVLKITSTATYNKLKRNNKHK